MRERETDRVVVVTGGASGLGAALVAALQERGDRPVVLDRRAPADELVDLADSKDTEEAVRRVGERFGRIDAVVTCAGIDVPGALGSVPAHTWERIVAVNLFGTASVVRAALPWLEASHGHIVTVTSTLGHKAVGDASAYCASKFGVVGLSRALTAELAGDVGVTMLVPGGMQTAFFDGRTEQYKPGPDAMLNAPENVAAAVVFALRQPEGCEVRELVVTPSVEPSWP